MINRHLCFVCDRSWPLFTNGETKGIGGVETRSVRLAEMMSRHFSKVTFAIKKTGYEIADSRGLNVVTYEPATISNAPNYGLAKIAADIYVVFESNYITADAVRTCNIIGKPVVYWCTSANDYNKKYTLDNHEEYNWGFIGRECAYCFYMADYIISQTEDQQKLLSENHGLDSLVISNPIELHPHFDNAPGDDNSILWVGRSDPYNKRPELLLEIARKLPGFKFSMILNNVNPVVFDKIVQSKPENVNIIEYIPPQKIDQLYKNSTLFLSTSSADYEGFPNVFLHAMSHRIPVVSLEVDPDGIFSRNKCGINCNGSIDIAVQAIEMLFNNKAIREEIGKRSYEYIKNKHSTENVSRQMLEFFSNVSADIKNPMKWIDYTFDRLFQKEYKKLEESHKALINHRMIKLLNKFRRIRGKTVWQ